MNNPYLECPEYETTHFIIRLISEDDAESLLKCYSDEAAQLIFNSDTCTGDFRINTKEEMADTVKAWIGCYERREFVRFAIIDKRTRLAVGTVEMFGMVGVYKADRGILRVDISSDYEDEIYLNEIFGLCIGEFFYVFGVKKIVTKAIPIAENRIKALMGLGFTPYDFPGRQYYFGLEMEHITTYKGENFTPLAPNPEQIHIEDIAHALSLMCRANGHIDRFYSVAQHSLNCANEAKARGLSARIQFACLLHDASEAYLSDITRPVKKHLPKYLQTEKRLQETIYQKYMGTPMSGDEFLHVDQIDSDILVCEFIALMKKKAINNYPVISGKPAFEFAGFTETENEYLSMFNELKVFMQPEV